MQDGADPCRKQFHLPVTVGFAIVKVEYPGAPILCNSRFDNGHPIYKVVMEEYINTYNEAAGIIDQGGNVYLVFLPVGSF